MRCAGSGARQKLGAALGLTTRRQLPLSGSLCCSVIFCVSRVCTHTEMPPSLRLFCFWCRRISEEAEEATLNFRNVFTGGILTASYRRGAAVLVSDSASTLAIVKELTSKEATARRVHITESFQVRLILRTRARRGEGSAHPLRRKKKGLKKKRSSPARDHHRLGGVLCSVTVFAVVASYPRGQRHGSCRAFESVAARKELVCLCL